MAWDLDLPEYEMIPDFQTLMRPTLSLHADGREWSAAELREALGQEFNLIVEEREELLPSRRQRRFDNRLGWAVTYLVQAGLLTRPRRAATRITDRGRELLQSEPGRIDMKVLEQFPEYLEFRTRSSEEQPKTRPTTAQGQRPEETATPEEVIENAYDELLSALVEELLPLVAGVSPEYFEQVVVDLLIAMGYGGSRADAGERLGRSGDEGLDGVIREDPLGLDVVYVQAKRWALERSVGRPDVQAFVGALQGARANKGVFLTTAQFTREARDYADSVAVRLVLIDGRRLARLMIEHGIGVTIRNTYAIKRVDIDYFAEDGSTSS